LLRERFQGTAMQYPALPQNDPYFIVPFIVPFWGLDQANGSQCSRSSQASCSPIGETLLLAINQASGDIWRFAGRRAWCLVEPLVEPRGHDRIEWLEDLSQNHERKKYESNDYLRKKYAYSHALEYPAQRDVVSRVSIRWIAEYMGHDLSFLR